MKTPNKAELARLCGISRQAISKHLRKPDAPRPDRQGRYDVAKVKAFLAERAELNTARPGGSYADALARRTEAQAKLAELDLDEREGRVIDRDTVEMQARAFVQTVQTDLLTMHATLALLVAGKPVSECAGVIRPFALSILKRWKAQAGSKLGPRQCPLDGKPCYVPEELPPMKPTP